MGSASQHLFRDLSRLSAAEEFFQYFDVPYDKHVVDVNRLHILQRFHQYLGQFLDDGPTDAELLRAFCAGLLERAYGDFTHSSAQTEKVFRVFRDKTPSVSVEALTRAAPACENGE
ncbi:MAG TPA: nitrogenase-stabilizing/protective protein NifW [Acidiferrobacter sp.]|nr:nitrogenase-stabilizing/protective protein NifW [Acidiferrobacter sp.]